MTTLAVHRLSHRYGPTEVLHGLELDVAAGETLAIVGPSGCGKTTLLNICAGLVHPAEGTVYSSYLRPAYVFQQPRLLPWKTALANIVLGLEALRVPSPERDERARRLAARMGLLSADLGKHPHELSGGMRSRISLARAFAIEPDLLLLDEPFTALDIGLKAELHGLLIDYASSRKCGVLLVTHDLMEAVRLSHRVLVLGSAPGRIVKSLSLTPEPPSRDEAFVFRTTAKLIALPEVRASFGLKLAPDDDRQQVDGSAIPPLRLLDGGCRA